MTKDTTMLDSEQEAQRQAARASAELLAEHLDHTAEAKHEEWVQQAAQHVAAEAVSAQAARLTGRSPFASAATRPPQITWTSLRSPHPHAS